MLGMLTAGLMLGFGLKIAERVDKLVSDAVDTLEVNKIKNTLIDRNDFKTLYSYLVEKLPVEKLIINHDEMMKIKEVADKQEEALNAQKMLQEVKEKQASKEQTPTEENPLDVDAIL